MLINDLLLIQHYLQKTSPFKKKMLEGYISTAEEKDFNTKVHAVSFTALHKQVWTLTQSFHAVILKIKGNRSSRKQDRGRENRFLFLKTLQVGNANSVWPPIFIPESCWGNSLTFCFTYLPSPYIELCTHSSSTRSRFPCVGWSLWLMWQ